MQMVIRIDWPLANDHPDGPASCKWSSELAGLLQIIIQMDWPLANDHPDGLASGKWSSGWTGLSQMTLLFLLCYSSPPQKKHIFLLQIYLLFPVNLLPCKKHIFVSKYIPHFFSRFCFPLWKNIFIFSKYNLPFPYPFNFSSAKKNSFSKYQPPFPSLFIFPSKDPKL